jgi:hypothetical protein
VGRRHYHPPRCKVCGAHEAEVGRISGTGRCIPCAIALAEANNEQLKAHDGPFFQHWRRQSAAALGALLVDEV